jgi:hypothetical protein
MKSLRVKAETQERLQTFKQTHQLDTWDTVIQELLTLHPGTMCQHPKPLAAAPELLSEEEEEEEGAIDPLEHGNKPVVKPNILRMVAVSRLNVEGDVPINKIPFVLAVASVYLNGKVNPSEIVSASTATRLCKQVWEYDAALLRRELEELDVVHMQPDISQRQGEERLALFVTGRRRGTAEVNSDISVSRAGCAVLIYIGN